MSNKQITALFAGTFDPYTIGHHRIVQRALAMSDRIVIAIGRNIGKQTMLGIEERIEAIKKLYADEHLDLVSAYGIKQAPTLVVVEDGVEVAKAANLSNIKKFIETSL